MSEDLLQELFLELDAPQGRYSIYDQYANNIQPLAFISPESRRMLGNRLSRMGVNIARLAVASIVERLRVSGFSDQRAWSAYQENDLDQTLSTALFDALLFGQSFILCWAHNGKATATVESPRSCAVIRDPADRTVLAGLKRYDTKKDSHAYVYLPDRVEHWVASSPGARTGFVLRETIEHDLGVCPLVPIDNGRSEIEDLLPLIDALSKLLLDMMIASEAAGKPRRWISGLELVERQRVDGNGTPMVDENDEPIMETVSPINDVNTIQTMIAENENTKFGQLDSGDLSSFESGVKVIISQIQALSALPSHYLNALAAAQVPSADGLRASEAALTARCEQKQLLFGRALEQVGKLLIAIDAGLDPADISLRVSWSPADTRSIAQETDAYIKQFQSGLIPASYALRKLGYTDDEILRIRTERRLEALDAIGVSNPTTPQVNVSQNGARVA